MNLVLAIGVLFTQQTLVDTAHDARLVFTQTSEKGGISQTQRWSGGPVGRTIETTYNSDGTLKSRSATISNSRGTFVTSATITEKGASVNTTDNGVARRTSLIPFAKEANVTDPSVNWFSSTQPEKGAAATFMSFEPERRYWEEVTVTFEGRGKLGGSVEGNLVTRKSARKLIHLLLDEKGMPLVWEEGSIRLVRIKAD